MAVSKKAMRNPEKWASVSTSPTFRAALLGDPCVYCGNPSEDREHVVPKSEGGKDKDNIVGACRDCNSKRGSKPFLLWMIERGFLHAIHDQPSPGGV